MRRNEILNLKWDHANLVLRMIRVEKTKSGKSNQSGCVFLNPETGRPFKTVRRGFENACRRAGIKNMRFHDLRHRFASRLIQKGADMVTVQKLLGHQSVVITQRYTHSNSSQMKEAVDLLAEGKHVDTSGNRVDLSHICHTVCTSYLTHP